MRKGILLFGATVLMLSNGCAAMNKFMDEANARSAADRAAALAQSHRNWNMSHTAPGKSVQDVMLAVEKIQTADGYTCRDVRMNEGADGNSVRVDCSKKKQVDLGAAVATNVLGNMLGADRGKIIKETREENNTYIGVNWAADGMSSSKTTAYGQTGFKYKVNQNDQQVEREDYNASDIEGFNQKVAAAVK